MCVNRRLFKKKKKKVPAASPLKSLQYVFIPTHSHFKVCSLHILEPSHFTWSSSAQDVLLMKTMGLIGQLCHHVWEINF